MNELWVARDVSGELNIHTARPHWNTIHEQWWATEQALHVATINYRFYTDLLPGQCRRLVMESEVGE